MSSFLYSSAAKVAPECLSSPSHLLTAQSNRKAMESPTSPNLRITPRDNLSEKLIKPINLSADRKVRLNPGLISPGAADRGSAAGHTNKENHEKLQPPLISSAYQAPASPEGGLWLKHTELDDFPSSPSAKPVISEPASLSKRPSSLGSEKSQMIRDPAYLLPQEKELDGRPPSPSNFKSVKMQVRREPAYQPDLVMNRPSSPSSFKSEKMQAIRGPAYQAELAMNRASSPPYLNAMKPRTQLSREADYQLPSQASGEGPKMRAGSEAAYETSWHDDKLSGMKESYRSSPRGRLASVVEESESFSRREFGVDGLVYMSTHSSANHAANFSTHSSYTHASFSSKLPSYHHNSSHNFTFPGTYLQTARSAPAGTAARTRSGFNFLRRGSSESGAKLAAYRRPKSKKPQSLGNKLMWPLIKIKNGYVGCMMGLEESGDLSGVAQGGAYATRARYFADVPISKIDSRNHG